MAIYGIGAYYQADVSAEFIVNNIAGTNWDDISAPELHRFIRTLKAGDIIYIKSCSSRSEKLFIKGIGIIADEQIVVDNALCLIGRNIKWLVRDSFSMPKPKEKNNVRSNTLYEEFHPAVQDVIIDKIMSSVKRQV